MISQTRQEQLWDSKKVPVGHPTNQVLTLNQVQLPPMCFSFQRKGQRRQWNGEKIKPAEETVQAKDEVEGPYKAGETKGLKQGSNWRLWGWHQGCWPGKLLINFVPSKIHWQKTFATFGLGSSLQLLVANWKKYPCEFHWQRGYLALAMVVRLDRNKLTAIAKSK